MKNIKKLLALVLALAICAAFALPALAEGEGTGYTLTMSGAQPGHKYTIYQIFSGDNSELDGKMNLVNIKYGTSGYGEEGQPADEDTLKELADLESDSTALNEFLLTEIVPDATIPFDGAQPSAEQEASDTTPELAWSGLLGGYYLVKDTTENIPSEEVRSAIMVKMVETTSITTKPQKPTSNKELGTEGIEPKDSYNIGDMVPFTLTANIPSSELVQFAVKKTPKFWIRFRDQMTAGLIIDETTFEVSLAGYTDTEKPVEGTLDTSVEVESGYARAFTYYIEDLFKYIGTDEGAWGPYLNENGEVVVTVTYQARLTEEAKINGTKDDPSAVNKAHLEFDNDPTDENDGDGKTTDTEVPVYTFSIKGHKVAETEDGENLAGAIFQLHWDNKDGDVVKLYTVEGVEGIFAAPKGEEIPETVKIGTETKTTTAYKCDDEHDDFTIKSNESGEFTIIGLPLGNYALVEIEAPTGYNKIDDPISIVVKENEDHGGVVYEYSGKDSSEVKIVNKSGSTLPSTGGMGTTILYIVGAVLVIGAGVVLFTKRRMSN